MKKSTTNKSRIHTPTSIADSVMYQQAESAVEDAVVEWAKHNEDSDQYAPTYAAYEAACHNLIATIDLFVAQQVVAAVAAF